MNINHEDTGKYEFSFNFNFLGNNNFSTSLYTKCIVTEKGNEVQTRIRYHHENDKLFIVGINKSPNLKVNDLRNFFSSLYMAAFYGYLLNKEVLITSGIIGTYDMNSRNFTNSEVHLQGKYRNFKNYLVLNRDISGNLFYWIYFYDIFFLKFFIEIFLKLGKFIKW